jgi:predicted TPR repeat methyltransferase
VADDSLAFLAARPAGEADIAAAVDVVVYIGDLAPLCAGVARTLRPGGVFAFTTERWNVDDPGEPPDGRGWRLRPTGRYQHARAWLQTLVADAGFAVELMEDRVLRYEFGLPVDSDLVVLRRHA